MAQVDIKISSKTESIIIKNSNGRNDYKNITRSKTSGSSNIGRFHCRPLSNKAICGPNVIHDQIQ